MTAEDLETLGKKASQGFGSGKYSTLTEAVFQTVKEGHYTTEQVRRVVEYTNQSAFLDRFKTASGENGSKVVHIDEGIANPDTVLRLLNETGQVEQTSKVASVTGATAVYGGSMSDYSSPPQRQPLTKEASATLDAYFFGEPKEEKISFDQAFNEAYRLRVDLAAASKKLAGEITGLEFATTEDIDSLYDAVKQAARSGISLGQIANGMYQVSRDPSYVKVAFDMVLPRLQQDRVFRTQEMLVDSLSKTASSGVLDVSHPLVTSYCRFANHLHKTAELRQARNEVDGYLAQVDNILKVAAIRPRDLESLGDAVASRSGVIPKAYAAADYLGHHAGQSAEKGMRVLMGEHSKAPETARKVTDFAVRNAPTIAGGLAISSMADDPDVRAGYIRAQATMNPLSSYYRQRQAIQRQNDQMTFQQTLPDGAMYGYGY